MAQSDKIVYVVHCVDTEGPLFEPIDATFERLKVLFNLDIEPSKQNLKKLQNLQIPLGGKEKEVANCISNKRLSFLEDWPQLNAVLQDLLSEQFRKTYPDSFGNGYIFNWYILDHVGFETNPRRRALGYHTILQYYIRQLKEMGCTQDRIFWHYHGVPFNRAANCFGKNWNFSNEHIQVITRRIVDYGLFPCSYRPGGHIERSDINLWLEQWIPFDYANQAMENDQFDNQPDFSHGRLADWRRAPKTWGAYHPCTLDYQSQGTMKRWIFRCLNLDSRLGSIDQNEVDDAFKMADNGVNPVLAVTNHDNRDMRDEIKEFYSLLQNSRKKYPGVKFRYVNAIDAARQSLSLRTLPRLELSLKWEEPTLIIKANHAIFGPQPFLAIKTFEGSYYHDNLDFQGDNTWSYTFDWMTIKPEAVECIGVASNDDYGNTMVVLFFPKTGKTVHHFENLPMDTTG